MHDMARGLSVIAERRRPVQQAVIHILTGVVSSLWPGTSVEPYGSFATGLTSPSSDVDLLVRRVFSDRKAASGFYPPPVRSMATPAMLTRGSGASGHTSLQVKTQQQTTAHSGDSDGSYDKGDPSPMSNSSTKNHNTNAKRDIDRNYNEASLQGGGSAGAYIFSFEMEVMVYRQLFEVLQKQTWVESCKLIPHTNVPIIKVQTGAVPMGHGSVRNGYKPLISIDIAIERPRIQGVPQQKVRDTTEVVCRLVDRFPAIRPLALIIKQLLVERGLNEPFNGGLTTYGLVLMITHILRRHERRHHATEVDGYNPNLGCILVAFYNTMGMNLTQ